MGIKLQGKTKLENFAGPSPAVWTDPVTIKGLTLDYVNYIFNHSQELTSKTDF